jgi:ABC-2 type transport system permease protein
LIGIAALFLHMLVYFAFDCGSALDYIVFLIAGGFCFSSFGMLVGFLCRTQASARTLGVFFISRTCSLPLAPIFRQP